MIFARIGYGPCYHQWNEIFAGLPPLCNDIMVLVEIVDIAQIIKMESLHASRKWFYSEFFFIELSKFMMKATT